MSAIDQLIDISGRFHVGCDSPGDIDVNVVDSVVLEYDFEYGWWRYLARSGRAAGTASDWHATPDAAVADLYAQVERKYPRP